VETDRLETFADGVFAIAATLLIIDVSADAPGGELGGALAHAWPQYAAYAVAFLTIGIMWVNHHACFQVIDRVDRTFLFLNVALLISVAFIPFPTRLVAEHIRDGGARDAVLAYGGTSIAMAAAFSGYWFYAARGRRLLAEDADERVVQGISRAFLPGLPTYVVVTLVAFWSPHAAVALFAALALFYVFESSLFARGR
jgi:TMEM175 potassium channel family protein